MLMNNIFKKSLPNEKVVHGYTIRRYPCGKYIKALNIIAELPTTLAKEIFPDKNIENIINDFTKIDEKMFGEMLGKAIAVIPEKAFAIISEITDIPYEDFMEKLSPNEVMDIMQAVWEVNDFSSFFHQVKSVAKNWFPQKK